MKEVILTAGILILVLAALRRLLRGKIAPGVQYGLWLLVVIRLLVPVELGKSALSALTLFDRAAQTSGAAAAATFAERPVFEVFASNVHPDLLPDFMETSLTWQEAAAAILPVVWGVGAAAVAVWFLLVNIRFRRELCRGAKPLETASRFPVYVTENAQSPCIVGLLRPRIYITPDCLTDEKKLRHVLAHEETHWRHGDLWWALVRSVCLCLYWFHPLVWWAASLSRQDGELCCDEGAIRALGETERLAYGRTLVDIVAQRNKRPPLLQMATTMADRKANLEERIRFIAKKPKTAVAALLCLLLVMGVTVGCTFTGTDDDAAAAKDVVERWFTAPDSALEEARLAPLPPDGVDPEEHQEMLLTGVYDAVVNLLGENAAESAAEQLIKDGMVVQMDAIMNGFTVTPAEVSVTETNTEGVYDFTAEVTAEREGETADFTLSGQVTVKDGLVTAFTPQVNSSLRELLLW